MRVCCRDWFAVLGLGLALPGAAADRPSFEVASIKRHTDSGGGLRLPSFSNDRFTATTWVNEVIAAAYQLPFNTDQRLSGGPAWLHGSDGIYDIDAKGSFPVGMSGSARDERKRLMLQALLADRFKLVIHRETKELPSYVLVVDKGGPKLEKSGISESDCWQPASAGQIPCHQLSGGRGRGFHARAVTVGDLLLYAENWSGRPLLDRTGLTGLYKVDTQPFLPMEVSSTPPAPGTKGEAGIDVADLPTLFQVFERLGLKMKAQRDQVDTYVIDSIQRPTEN